MSRHFVTECGPLQVHGHRSVVESDSGWESQCGSSTGFFVVYNRRTVCSLELRNGMLAGKRLYGTILEYWRPRMATASLR